MKKIIFCLQTMVLGGVEKELITLLKEIHDQYQITLLLLYKSNNAMLKEIPGDVKIIDLDIPADYYCGGASELISQRIKAKKIPEALSIFVKRCLGIGMPPANTNISGIPQIDDCFDVAICYHIHSPLMLRYVAERINADKKVAWIHNDFYVSGYKIKKLRKFVSAYDEFVAVSKKVENEFRELLPWYKGGISTAHNYLNSKEIIELSACTITENEYLNDKRLKILTVGRFTEQKGIDLAIIAGSILKESGCRFHWYIIGYGALEETYYSLIDKYNVSDCVTILGQKSNPYPYIKNCDIFVLPSRHEAYPLTIMEAKILNRPIVCTNFDGADELIDSGKNGIIVPLNDAMLLAEEIEKLIDSPEKRALFSEECSKENNGNDLQEIVKHF